MPRLLSFVLIGVLTLSLLLLASLLSSRPWEKSPLLANRFKEITPGMSRSQVEQLLGGPAGDFGFNQGGPISQMKLDWEDQNAALILEWFNDEVKLLIAFDSAGQVVAKQQQPSFLRTPPPLSWRYWWNCYVK